VSRILTNLPFDLPSEAQWEFAAREGGRNLLFASQTDGMNYSILGYKEGTIAVDERPVASYQLGLFHMNSNVSEWVLDWYSEKYSIP